MQSISFRSPYFALLESCVPQLLAGPEARTSRKAVKLAAGQIGIFGVLGGQADWFTDTSYEEIRANIRRALADPTVRTIDLVIDSPGGSTLGLPEAAEAIYRANRNKPVRSLVTGIAASAGYWLASQGGTISLTPSGEVGSVGVLDIHTDISKALENAGVKVTAVASTKEKIERAPFIALSDEARTHMQASVGQWYGSFLSAVRRGRGMRVPNNHDFGGGRMLSSAEALREGLVDFVGEIQ